jgi:6-phosphogluconolactonase
VTRETLVFIGTYTRGSAPDGSHSEGIYAFRLNTSAAALELLSVAGGVVNPSFVAIHPSQRYLYSVSEIGGDNGDRAGGIAAFHLDTISGKLDLLNIESTRGNGPCHLSIDLSGHYVLAANYGSGSLVVLPILEDGRVGPATSFVQNAGSGPNPRRQEGPHAHSIYPVPGTNLVLANDLGIDKVLIFRFDETTGRLIPNDPPSAPARPGAGPRHLAIDGQRRHVYVVNELASTVAVYRLDPEHGVLTPGEVVSTLPAGFTGDTTCAEVQLSPDGRFLYASNRGHDSLAVFRVDAEGDHLTPVGHIPTRGRTPRNFGIHPDGQWLIVANQQTSDLFTFRREQQTGFPVGEPIRTAVPQPVCVKFLVQSA